MATSSRICSIPFNRSLVIENKSSCVCCTKQNSKRISYVLQYSEINCSRLYLLVTLPLNPIAAIIAHTAAEKSDVNLGTSIGVVQLSVEHAAMTSVGCLQRKQ